MEIRLATLNDIEQLCPLFTEFFAYNAVLQPEYCNESNENGKYPESVIKEDNADIVIAVDNGVIVGYVHIRESKTLPYDPIVQHKYAEIVDFMVTDSYRRKGVGLKLMDAAKDWGTKRNLDYIELFVLSNAKEANAFYHKYGFKIKSHTMRYKL